MPVADRRPAVDPFDSTQNITVQEILTINQ